MNFRKYPHPANFRFVDPPAGDPVEGGVADLVPPFDAAPDLAAFGLRPSARGLYGRCGEAFMFCFERLPGDRFYGLGEKWTGFEHSGRAFRFWNSDVLADFHPSEWRDGQPPVDPAYLSIPYLILKRGERFTGLLLETWHPASVSTGGQVNIEGQLDVGDAPMEFWLAADSGPARLAIFDGPTLAEVTRRYQTRIGTTPLPPAWALGYHQCRWGYQSEADLAELDAAMSRHRIPCDGLWLDIGYMDGFRVFTFAENHFPDPEAAIARLGRGGRRVVPIIDPGVKREPGYAIYERGREAGAFCQNPEGLDYVGLVWPGETVFPDFSLESAKAWWAAEVARFASRGIAAAWLDMNDPSTGPADSLPMLFGRGSIPHAHFRNAYALGMAEATRAGFLAARPGERPFLLSRSGCLGSHLHTAIWTGDNSSNYHHLKTNIATTLNLALSGIPFNAPDTGGFTGHCTGPLLRDWFKACFLFPILRNHSVIGSHPQEPWAFDDLTLDVVRHFIALRYRFRPHLYQLFHEHRRTGDAILRPLFYGSAEGGRFDLADDLFLVGEALLHAPFVEENAGGRTVPLPGGTPWFDLFEARWVEGGQDLRVAPTPRATPLFVRDRTILPLARLDPADHAFDARRADFHLFLSGDAEAELRYVFDDGITHPPGPASEIRLRARREGHAIHLEIETARDGFGPGDFTFSTLPPIDALFLHGRALEPAPPQGLPAGTAAWSTFHLADPTKS